MSKRLLTLMACTGILLAGFTIPSGKITVYTIGDSTMADKVPSVYPETGWCQVLPQFFDKDVIVKNRAVNGRSTKSFISEGRWQAVLDSLKPGDYVIIQFGHNDQKDKDSTRFTNPYIAYRSNLKKFVSEALAKGATPILATSIVRRNFNESGVLIDTHGAYPEVMRTVAKEMKVPLVDLQMMTEEMVVRYGMEGSKSLYVFVSPGQYPTYPQGREDNTHLSERGAREVATLFVLGLSHIPLSLAGHVKPLD
jgi:lysophospholipase L1-like esterase